MNYLFTTKEDVVRNKFWNQLTQSDIKKSGLLLSADKWIDEVGLWSDFSANIEDRRDLQFSISKVFNKSNGNDFNIVGETQTINDTKFTILDTNSFAKDSSYSTLHTLIYSGLSGWSDLNNVENSIYIGKGFASELLISRGRQPENYTELIGSELIMRTPKNTMEPFKICGITFVDKDAAQVNGYLYDVFSEDVFMISHKKAEEYESNTLFALFGTVNKKITFEYFDFINSLAKVNERLIFVDVSLNKLLSDYSELENRRYYLIIEVFSLCLLVIFCSHFISYLRTFLKGNKSIFRLSARTLYNVFFPVIILIIFIIVVIILRNINFLAYSLPALNIAGMNFLSLTALVLVCMSLYFGTKIRKSITFENPELDQFEKHLRYYQERKTYNYLDK